MNDFLEKVHKRIIDSMPQFAPNTGLFTVDIIVNNVIECDGKRWGWEDYRGVNRIFPNVVKTEKYISKIGNPLLKSVNRQ